MAGVQGGLEDTTIKMTNLNMEIACCVWRERLKERLRVAAIQLLTIV